MDAAWLLRALEPDKLERGIVIERPTNTTSMRRVSVPLQRLQDNARKQRLPALTRGNSGK